MTGEALERLRAESSRGVYASMARLARALYRAGLGPREVLRQCYGVDFPEEFFVLAEPGPWAAGLLLEYTNQPWQLAVPLDRGGPASTPDLMDEIEQRIFARDPDLIPLGLTGDLDSSFRGMVLCYRRKRLKAGRTTVYGIREEVKRYNRVVRSGRSFLAVVRQHQADVVRRRELRRRLSSNRGAGSIDAAEVAEVRALVARVEELQREVASREGG